MLAILNTYEVVAHYQERIGFASISTNISLSSREGSWHRFSIGANWAFLTAPRARETWRSIEERCGAQAAVGARLAAVLIIVVGPAAAVRAEVELALAGHGIVLAVQLTDKVVLKGRVDGLEQVVRA